MPLTKRQKGAIGVCAELMGENAGFYYRGLPLDSRVTEADANGRTKLQGGMRHVLEKALANYGLNGFVGESIYDLAARGEISMRIRVPNPVRPHISECERRVLEAAVKVLAPRGGYFYGFREEVGRLADTPNRKTSDIIGTLSRKFNARNIEEAIATAIVSGVIDPKKLFGDQIPKPLSAVTNLWMRTKLEGSTALAPDMVENLTDDEKAVVLELIRRTCLNGGLCGEWWQDVAAVTGKSYSAVLHIVQRIRQRFGTDKTGAILYAASRHLKMPVVVELPPRVDASISKVERIIMLETARILLPAGGIYNNYLRDVSGTVHYAVATLRRANHVVIEKMQTANISQAVTSLIANGVIPVSQLGLDVEKTPALEAIVGAMQRSGYKI